LTSMALTRSMAMGSNGRRMGTMDTEGDCTAVTSSLREW
jgi:hypothetical protein